MKIIKTLFWVIVLVMSTGCSVTPSPTVPQRTPPDQTQPVSPEPTASLYTSQVSQTQPASPGPTATVYASQVSQTETVMPQATAPLPAADGSPTLLESQFTVRHHCPDEKVGIGGLPELPGTLVFSADNSLAGKDILAPEAGMRPAVSFWQPGGISTISTYPLEDEESGYYYYVESPDKEKLAVTQAKTQAVTYDLIVVDRQGKELGRVPVPDRWTFFYWRNNEQFLFERMKLREKYELTAVDLVDKVQQSVPTDFPDMYISDLFLDWGAQVLFNPQETLVVYPVVPQNRVQSVIWNVKEGKEVARIERSNWARWSPDGKRLLLVGDVEDKIFERRDDILLIDASGEQQQATFFAKYFVHMWIDQPVWSPDSRYIAFWLVRDVPIQTAQLGILDTETMTVDLFCKVMYARSYASFDESSMLGYAFFRAKGLSPIWSPDSQYVLIEDYKGIESSAYLFNLQDYSVTKIADKARPVGWLK